MVYKLVIKVDGGCRGNGQPGAIGAAAAVFFGRGGNAHTTWTREMPRYPYPTSQRAEIAAIILALEQALEKYRNLDTNQYMDVTIMSDSRYAVACMNTWIYKWSENGWITAAGHQVVNKDLIQEASDLDDDLARLGQVKYEWIPRSENEEADEACDRVLDDM